MIPSSTELNLKINETATFLKDHIDTNKPLNAVVLGSGYQGFSTKLGAKTHIKYANIPNFPISTVPGHEGQLGILDRDHDTVLIFQGRHHYYEGYDLTQVTFPMRVLGSLGCRSAILTNASGGINLDYKVGDLVAVSDHINFSGVNPLRGPHSIEFGDRFVDLSNAYNRKERRSIHNEARKLGIPIRDGVYVCVSGPSYETPSEIKMFRTMGGDLIGMSTVPEVLVGHQMGIRISVIATITNMAAGVTDEVLSHEDVIEVTNKTSGQVLKLLHALINRKE
eukprot:TRINITY_DN306_c0_g1_i2.p1 TRINITY_DN306_c0_g1~~TRINITY_DN306_c0_g1_i2.p1  ORF type:complete len:280 (+),score=44.04 TRINITY_DN306_c0_g1_i2:684-1523(+)